MLASLPERKKKQRNLLEGDEEAHASCAPLVLLFLLNSVKKNIEKKERKRERRFLDPPPKFNHRIHHLLHMILRYKIRESNTNESFYLFIFCSYWFLLV